MNHQNDDLPAVVNGDEHVYEDVNHQNDDSPAAVNGDEHVNDGMNHQNDNSPAAVNDDDSHIMPSGGHDEYRSNRDVAKLRSNSENVSCVKQSRLLIGILLSVVACFLGLAAVFIRQQLLSDSIEKQTSGEWGSWQSWTACSVSCDEGTRARVRQCVNSSNECTGQGFDMQMCYLRNCTASGHWKSWQDWTDCSSSCGDGTRVRVRQCDHNECPGTGIDLQRCNLGKCAATDGGWAAWSSWSVCSRTCGDGINSRSRTCNNPTPSTSGRYCAGDPTQTQSCKVRRCPDGGWSAWSAWNDCSRSCGDGINSRSRNCDNPTPSTSGRHCAGDSSQAQLCHLKNCPDGGWSAWSSWSVCSRSCGDGINSRSRTCDNPTPSTYGRYCAGDSSQAQLCTLKKCPDGGWSAWSSWSVCSRSCGDGINSRSRICDNPTPSTYGRFCAGDSSQAQLCTLKNCPDGGWSAWSTWSVCSRSCGDGINSRSRTCNNPTPSTSGRYCAGDPLQTQSCHLKTCPDGGWSAWSTWSVCSRSCGDGINSRSRTCNNPTPSTSGRYCAGDPLQAQLCNLKNCPDGGWSAWSTWSVCSRSCGDGINSRSRTCNNPTPATSGRYCAGDPTQAQLCHLKNCPDGGWSAWSTWSVCSRSCGDGINSRSRTCNNPTPATSGRYCAGDPTQTQSCKVRSCPVKVSAFTATYPTGDAGSTLRFTHVILNEGANYSPSTGNFTCTIPGVYFFTLSLVKKRSSSPLIDRVDAYICQNGSWQVNAFIDPDDGDADKGSYGVTASVTLRLHTGDIVYAWGYTPASAMESRSMFSGFIIQPDDN